MAKKARVRFSWLRSVSPDVAEQQVTVRVDGVVTLESVLEADTQEIITDVAASSSVEFSVLTVDHDGNETPSETYTFVVGDLEAPQPATGLAHEILGVVDVPDEPVAP